MRIAFAGFEHETNTFAPSPADIRAFELGGGWPGMVSGEAIYDAMLDANIPASGFIAAARTQGCDLVPTTWAAASPSGPVTRDAYEQITARIIEQIAAAGPVDALYLDLHGAMVAEHVEDGEGELLTRVRQRFGPDLPIAVSLDLHANVTARMLAQADALIAFRTYPHVDMAETGARAFQYLWQRLHGMPRHRPVWRRLPFLIPICWQSTELEPARRLYRELEAWEDQEGVTSMSMCLGFPAADFPECAGMVWGYGPNDAAVTQAVDQLYADVCASEPAFAGTLYSPQNAVSTAIMLSQRADKPVIIADAQDNPGAGSDSDTTGVLRALVDQAAPDAALGLIVDGEAAAAAHAAGKGATVRLSLGGKSGVAGDAPLEADYLVEKLSDGEVLANGPYYRGIRMSLGPSACLRLGTVRIAVSTDKAQMADTALFRYVGIEPTAQKILVVKSAVHFRADFQPIAHDILVAAAPGSMMMDPADLPWRHLSADIRMHPGGPTFEEWRKAIMTASSEH